jgi:hypothetical protein
MRLAENDVTVSIYSLAESPAVCSVSGIGLQFLLNP